LPPPPAYRSGRARVSGRSGGGRPLSEPLDPGVVAALREPAAYPGDPSAAQGVEWVQTHLSHVFLTGRRVYKLRKAVDLGFVCFDTRAERNADCLREVALNRRLAPDVYLGVAPIEPAPGGARVGALAEGLVGSGEHCVVMRRLPAGRDALALLQRGGLPPEALDRVAERVAEFHARHGLGVPAPFSPEAWLARCTRPVEDNFALLADGAGSLFPRELLERAQGAARAFSAARTGRFEARRRAGRAVDGHGDLHLQHVWFETDEAEPIFVDCIEFNEGLRRIDAAAEVAFLAMDLRYRGADGLAARFLRRYARASDDFDLYSVVDYFVSYRAAVRAKVASVAARDPGIDAGQRARAAESALRHLELAAQALAPTSGGAIVIVGGVVGTGKSTVAEALADRVGGVVVSSDRVRKREAGLAPTDRAGAAPGRGIYTPEWTERVYAGLVARAAPVAASGRVAILDATFASRAQRRRAREAAAALGVPARFLETRCAARIALERLARRAAVGTDPSDAGPGLHARSAAAFEPVRADEGLAVEALDTGDPAWPAELARLAARWGLAHEPAATARAERGGSG
jgi:aminoglycoside phosphotransferase family enzyme/predicted kinase